MSEKRRPRSAGKARAGGGAREERANSADGLVYRAARRTDVDALVDLSLRAYRVSSAEARRDFYTDHPRFETKDVRVGEIGGELVASLVLYPFHAYVRGEKLQITGIGSVAVSPEHRRRGVADALLRSTLTDMRERGDAWSMLYPFRGDFYRRFGWGLVETPTLLSVPPSALPSADEARRVRRARVADRPLVQALYDRVVKERGHFTLARRPAWWERRLWGYEGEWLVYERARGEVEGYQQLQVDSSDGPWKLVITVNEFVAATPEAHRGLTGYLHGLRDQAVEVVLAAAGDAPWSTQLADAANLRGEMKLGVLRSAGHAGYGAMLRVLDVKAALGQLPVASEAHGEVVLDLRDDLLPANAGAWLLKVREGGLDVRPEPAGANHGKLPRLGCTVDVLASVVAGALSPVRAAEVGLLESAHGAAERVEPWFRGRAVFVMPMNAF
ncbi:MAG TPA: GNAT family N-acetyltransferase [Methylomirabilota bacterium]|nr:GNAT family N-acetyltransferase [Methylomirabilota bacterium]